MTKVLHLTRVWRNGDGEIGLEDSEGVSVFTMENRPDAEELLSYIHEAVSARVRRELEMSPIDMSTLAHTTNANRSAVLVWSSESSYGAQAIIGADISELMQGYENLKAQSLEMFRAGLDEKKRDDPFTDTDAFNVYLLYAYVKEGGCARDVELDVCMNLDIMLPNALVRFVTIPENY